MMGVGEYEWMMLQMDLGRQIKMMVSETIAFCEKARSWRTYDAQQKMVANAVAPSIAFPIEDSAGNVNGVLVVEGALFAASSLIDKNHTEFWFGGQ